MSKHLSEIYKKKNWGNWKKKFRSNERSSKILAKLLGNVKGKLLDIGAWGGELEKFLPPNVEYYPLDVMPIKHKNAKKWDLNKGYLPYKNKEFDCVVASMIIEHTFFPIKICKEIRRVLKDNGFAMIGLPNESSLWNKLDSFFKFKYDTIEEQEFQHHWFFNIRNSKIFLNNCGFRIINIYPRFGITSKWIKNFAPLVWYKIVKK